MNIGITTSFLVGGLLLLSILQMNFTVNNNAIQTTLQLATKTKMESITKTLAADFGRMGLGSADKKKVIKSSSDSLKITFEANVEANIEENNDGTVREVTWELTTTEYDSPNPHDYQLVRTGIISAGNVQKTIFSAVEFKLTYFDSNNNRTTDFKNATQIKVKVVCESPEAITVNKSGGEIAKRYGRSVWQKTFLPPSLQFK